MGDHVMRLNERGPAIEEIVTKHLGDLTLILRGDKETLPKNILLLGRPSAGKSSVINLFRSALVGDYEEIANPGSAAHGRVGSFTGHLRAFRNMGLTDQELQEFIEFHMLDPQFQLPTVWDMPGLDEYTNNKKSILSCVLDGLVPEDTEILSALGNDSGVSRLTSKLDEENIQRRKIDRVVFVASFQQDVPEHLFSEVMKLICHTDGERRSIPYIFLFTHSDRIGDQGVSQEKASERKGRVADILNIGNNLELNSHCVTNYTDEGDKSEDKCWKYDIDLNKRIEGLKVMCKLFRRRQVIDDRITLNKWTLAYYSLQRFIPRWDIQKVLILSLLVLAMALILFAGTNSNRQLTQSRFSEADKSPGKQSEDKMEPREKGGSDKIVEDGLKEAVTNLSHPENSTKNVPDPEAAHNVSSTPQDPMRHVKEQMDILKSMYEKNNETFPQNVLLIGTPGAGKRSLVNLFRAALVGNFKNIAHAGSRKKKTMSSQLHFYKNMGLTDEELETFRLTYGFESKGQFKLPTIIDMPGINGNESNLKHALNYVIDGVVREDSSLATIYDCINDMSSLDFNETNRINRRVDHIIFVVSVIQDAPHKLFANISDFIFHLEGRQRMIPFKLLFTHVDYMVNETISEATVNERKNLVADALDMGIHWKLHSYDTVGYSDRDPRHEIQKWHYKVDLEKHISALQIFCSLCIDRAVFDNETYVYTKLRREPFFKRYFGSIPFRTGVITFIIAVGGIGWDLYKNKIDGSEALERAKLILLFIFGCVTLSEVLYEAFLFAFNLYSSDFYRSISFELGMAVCTFVFVLLYYDCFEGKVTFSEASRNACMSVIIVIVTTCGTEFVHQMYLYIFSLNGCRFVTSQIFTVGREAFGVWTVAACHALFCDVKSLREVSVVSGAIFTLIFVIVFAVAAVYRTCTYIFSAGNS